MKDRNLNLKHEEAAARMHNAWWRSWGAISQKEQQRASNGSLSSMSQTPPNHQSPGNPLHTYSPPTYIDNDHNNPNEGETLHNVHNMSTGPSLLSKVLQENNKNSTAASSHQSSRNDDDLQTASKIWEKHYSRFLQDMANQGLHLADMSYEGLGSSSPVFRNSPFISLKSKSTTHVLKEKDSLLFPLIPVTEAIVKNRTADQQEAIAMKTRREIHSTFSDSHLIYPPVAKMKRNISRGESTKSGSEEEVLDKQTLTSHTKPLPTMIVELPKGDANDPLSFRQPRTDSKKQKSKKSIFKYLLHAGDKKRKKVKAVLSEGIFSSRSDEGSTIEKLQVAQSMDYLDTSLVKGEEKSKSLFHLKKKSINKVVHSRSFSTPSKEAKVAFTKFHNSHQYGIDAGNAYLGKETSVHNAHSFSMYGAIERTPQGTMLGCSVPLSSNSNVCRETLLFPIEGSDTWVKGNSYLIVPSIISLCSKNVLRHFWGEGHASYKLEEKQIYDFSIFGKNVLGAAAIAELGGSRHSIDSTCKWSCGLFVARQNYIFQYNIGDNACSHPHGCAHLESAKISAHPVFLNALEMTVQDLQGGTKRLLLRLESREERDRWVGILIKASKLGMHDLYEIHAGEPIGVGRYASIHRARRKNCDHLRNINPQTYPLGECALKIINKHEFWKRVGQGRERMDTLVREAAVQATLSTSSAHQYFIRIYGIFETHHELVLELELLTGVDLFRHVSSKTVLEEQEAAQITRDLLVGLSATKSLGVAHRDVKLANVFMRNFSHVSDVSVKLGDYGMATFVGVDGLVRGRCGTPGYVAPEILLAGTNCGYGNMIDVFSAGVVLYILLCGYEPFYGETDAQLIAANRDAEFEFHEGDWDDVSHMAKNLISRMLDPNPSTRITPMDALKHPWILSLVPVADSMDSSGSIGSGDNVKVEPYPRDDVNDACTIS